MTIGGLAYARIESAILLLRAASWSSPPYKIKNGKKRKLYSERNANKEFDFLSLI